MRWFAWFRKREFPLPKDHHMTLDELFRYWRKMPRKYRAECEWFLYRLDPAKAPVISLLKFRETQEQVLQDGKAFGLIPPDAESMRFLAVDRMSPDPAWWAAQADPGAVDERSPHAEHRCYFLARINRRWKVSGAERHAEVGVAAFDLVPEAAPQLRSSRTGQMI